MIFAYCLADFFNLDLWPTGREPRYQDIRNGIDDLVEASLSAMPVIPVELTVRLYGGWHGEVPDTRVHVREITEAAIREYPRRLGKSRLRIEVADSPVWNASLRLPYSARRVPMRSEFFQFHRPHLCPLAGQCTLLDLQHWTRGTCPNSACTVKVGDVAWRYRQKMVDTLLTVDALMIQRDDLADLLIIASDDDDMIPVLLALTNGDTKTIRLRRQGTSNLHCEMLLDSQGIQTANW